MKVIEGKTRIWTPFGVATVTEVIKNTKIIKNGSNDPNDPNKLNEVELWFNKHFYLIFPDYERPINTINTNTKKYVGKPGKLIYINAPATLETIKKLATYKDLEKGIKLNEI